MAPTIVFVDLVMLAEEIDQPINIMNLTISFQILLHLTCEAFLVGLLFSKFEDIAAVLTDGLSIAVRDA